MKKALVIFSGGQDSTTCLFCALKDNDVVEAVIFDYGQRHAAELTAARNILLNTGVAHHVISVPGILKGSSPLITHSNGVHKYESADVLPGGLENTFVPARNLLFLTLAANLAYEIGAHHLYTGVCEEDFGGYPDCRRVFIDAAEKAINLALFLPDSERQLSIVTPLMNLTKAESVLLAQSLPGCMEALAYSHTCYEGAIPPCGKCHSCLLRARGFEQAGVVDPLITRLGGAQ